MDKTLELIDQLDEARATAEMCLDDLLWHSLRLLALPAGDVDRAHHRQWIVRLESGLRYWGGRAEKLEAKLPALVQAEEVVAAAW